LSVPQGVTDDAELTCRIQRAGWLVTYRLLSMRTKPVPFWLIAQDASITAIAWVAIAQSMCADIYLLHNYFTPSAFELTHETLPHILVHSEVQLRQVKQRPRNLSNQHSDQLRSSENCVSI